MTSIAPSTIIQFLQHLVRQCEVTCQWRRKGQYRNRM